MSLDSFNTIKAAAELAGIDTGDKTKRQLAQAVISLADSLRTPYTRI